MSATLYQFGLNNSVGAAQLTAFFQLLRIDTHVGVSESSLRQRLKQMEASTVTYQQVCEDSATVPSSARTVASDETFFHKLTILVMMDLPSGYILLEKFAVNRRFETWQAETDARLSEMGLTVRHAVSDRASALIKLARDSFGCVAGADLFHVVYDLGRWLSTPLACKTRQALAYKHEIQALLEKEQGKQKHCNHREVGRLQALVVYATKQHDTCLAVQQTWKQHRQAVSHCLHPFNLSTGSRQDETTVLTILQQEATAIGAFAEKQGIPDPKERLHKFRRQHEDLSQHVGVWWLWINTLLMELQAEPDLQAWITDRLMPVVYWHDWAERTQTATDRKLYRIAWENARQAFDENAFTQAQSAETVEHWLAWCTDKIRHFQRSSSAVEGRNGYLSQMYHNRRGLTENRLAALTVIHNYAKYHPDGSTPASRLYETEFPDLFEWLLKEAEVLPLPRKRRAKKKSNPLIQKKCPALSG